MYFLLFFYFFMEWKFEKGQPVVEELASPCLYDELALIRFDRERHCFCKLLESRPWFTLRSSSRNSAFLFNEDPNPEILTLWTGSQFEILFLEWHSSLICLLYCNTPNGLLIDTLENSLTRSLSRLTPNCFFFFFFNLALHNFFRSPIIAIGRRFFFVWVMPY